MWICYVIVQAASLHCDGYQVSYGDSRFACLTTADDFILPTEDAPPPTLPHRPTSPTPCPAWLDASSFLIESPGSF